MDGRPAAERAPPSTLYLRASLAALAAPPSLLAIGLLIVNDHVLKVHFPSELTGKLSDFAGLYFTPLVVLCGFFGLVWLVQSLFEPNSQVVQLSHSAARAILPSRFCPSRCCSSGSVCSLTSGAARQVGFSGCGSGSRSQRSACGSLLTSRTPEPGSVPESS